VALNNYPDAIACDLPEDYPTLKTKLPTVEKMSCDQFYKMIISSKTKGNIIYAMDQFIRRGDRRGYINMDENMAVRKKLDKYLIPVE